MAENRDVLVLGADLEGLTAAALLARAGKRVTVVEPRTAAGGLAAREEFHAGHAVQGLLHDTHLVRRDLLAPLELEKHGLVWRSAPAPIHALGESGTGIALGRDTAGANGDARAEWRAFLNKLTDLVGGVLDDPPPKAIAPDWRELMRLGRQGLRLRKLGDRGMLEVMRIPAMSAADWMGEHFEDPLLSAGLVAPALIGTVLGPRAPGTAGLVLLRESAAAHEPEGGLAALVDALVACCVGSGVELRLGEPVKGIRTTLDGVTGVVLENGEDLEAKIVASALDPKRTLLDLVASGMLSPETEAAVGSWRTRGSTAVLRLALSKAPAFEQAGGRVERFVTARSLEQLERTADGLKYGRLPKDPWLDVRLFGASLSVHVHGVPYELEGGWTNAAREDLFVLVLDALEGVVPGLRDDVQAHELLIPPDIEERYGTTGGHLHHGEFVLDQLWLQRPSLALSRYAAPIEGLYLCGSGSHPGGPFACGAGALAARAILA